MFPEPNLLERLPDDSISACFKTNNLKKIENTTNLHVQLTKLVQGFSRADAKTAVHLRLFVLALP